MLIKAFPGGNLSPRSVRGRQHQSPCPRISPLLSSSLLFDSCLWLVCSVQIYLHGFALKSSSIEHYMTFPWTVLAMSSISSPLCSQAVAAGAGMWPSGSGMCLGKVSHQEGARSRAGHVPGAFRREGSPASVRQELVRQL